MKIQTLHRSLEAHLPSTSTSTAPVSRNLDPALHPLQRAREYTRALQASKLSRMFAKPFLGALEGHDDGVYSMAKDIFGGERNGSAGAVTRIASGGGDGDVRVWDLGGLREIWSVAKGHQGMVSGVCFSHFGENGAEESEHRGIKRMRKGKEIHNVPKIGSSRLLSCGIDKTVKLWDISATSIGSTVVSLDGDQMTDSELVTRSSSPLVTYTGKSAFHALSPHRTLPLFATASHSISIYDALTPTPLSTLHYNSSDSAMGSGESMLDLEFNPGEVNVLASCGTDRKVGIWDVRAKKGVSRIEMNMRVNKLSFNPLQPPVLLCASEDHNLYTFDIRNLKNPTQIYKSHVGPVMSCDWSPTGREFVSGSYDKTVRLWTVGQGGSSRDMYHTKRMQRVFSTLYTLDASHVLSGSSDSSIRLWKSQSSAPGPSTTHNPSSTSALSTRQQSALAKNEALLSKWGQVGPVRKIYRQRYVPKEVWSRVKEGRERVKSRTEKEERRKAHAPKKVRMDEKSGEGRKGERGDVVMRVEN